MCSLCSKCKQHPHAHVATPSLLMIMLTWPYLPHCDGCGYAFLTVMKL